MTTAIEIAITAADGAKRELRFNKAQVATALAGGEKLDTIQPTDIGDIKFIDKSIDLQEILHLFDFVSGKANYDYEFDSDAYAALDLESELAFDPESWDEDLAHLASLDYTSRYIQVYQGEFIGWLTLVPTSIDQVTPMFIDENGPRFVEEIAEFTWSNDSTGAPVSWDGGSRLYKIGNTVYACVYFGDHDWRDSSVLLKGSSDSAKLSTVIDYIVDEVHALDAILALRAEVSGTLDELDSQIFAGWLESLQEETGLYLLITGEEKDRVHQALLDRMPGYRQLANFFQSPRAIENAEIWSVFEACADAGDIVSLIHELDSSHVLSVESAAPVSTDDVMTVFENKVMAGRYGLADGQILSLRELAQSFGVSEERIQQIEAKNKAILESKLKRRSEDQG